MASEYLEARGATLDAFVAAGGEVVADASRIDPIYPREPALVWWFTDPDGNPYEYDADGQRRRFHRVRLLGRTDAFRQPRDSGTHVYYVQHANIPWSKLRGDASHGLIISEGETRGLAGAEHDLPVISITGVDCWQVGGELHPDLAEFDLRGRPVYLAFDSDASRNERVQNNLDRLAAALRRRGADVYQIRLPAAPDGSKQGLDDYLARYGVEKFHQLRNSPETVPIGQKDINEPPLPLSQLMATNYPPTEWVWKDFVLKGEVNLLYGDGGVGKSLLSLYIGIAAAAGGVLFGSPTMQMPVLALFAEDNPSQVQQRVSKALIELGLDANGVLPMGLWCQPSGETALARVDDNGAVTELPRLGALRTELAEVGRPALVILDSLADLFEMNENLRLPVNAALKKVLGSLCRDLGASVLVLAHPSKASMHDGTHYSGSTAFNNGVRHRLTLEILPREDGDLHEGPPPRRLSVAKSNYGAMAEKTLFYYGPSISELPQAAATTPEEEERAVLATVLGMIDQGIRIVRGNGNGQKPRDVAMAIKEKFGITVVSSRVAQHLARWERNGVLAYRQGDKNKRPYVPAGFERGPKCTA